MRFELERRGVTTHRANARIACFPRPRSRLLSNDFSRSIPAAASRPGTCEEVHKRKGRVFMRPRGVQRSMRRV
jgi:hypothetical protein